MDRRRFLKGALALAAAPVVAAVPVPEPVEELEVRSGVGPGASHRSVAEAFAEALDRLAWRPVPMVDERA